MGVRNLRQLRAAHKATVLLEALPWLQEFAGARIVIKYGGNAMTERSLQRAFAEDVVFLRSVGLFPIVVHGGGPQISNMLSRLSIDSEFRGGLRVTSDEAMDVVRMVLTGKVQRELVSLLNATGPYAVGMSGEDAGLFKARKKYATVDGRPVDIGNVGEMVEVDPTVVDDLLQSGRIPVISTVAIDVDDPATVLNVNADTAAGELAAAINARKLVVLTDVAGLYDDWPKRESLISSISASDLRTKLPSLASGMVPKMEACLRAVDAGVAQAHVIDGRVAHSMLLEVFTDEGVGTVVTADGAKAEFPIAQRDPQLPPPLPATAAASAPASKSWRERYSHSLLPVFGTPQLKISAAHGSYLWDDNDKRYLDLLGGIAVNALGHGSPEVIEAVFNQLSSVDHVSNFFTTEPQIHLAERLLSLLRAQRGEQAAPATSTPEESSSIQARDSKVFLCNSGTEANEAALKLARAAGGPDRPRILALRGAFHGRSTGALALTYKHAYREPFQPLIEGVEFIEPNDIDALRQAIKEDVAAVFIEPIQGEAGVHPLTADYLRAARQLTAESGALLIFDEVQCGMGRTGQWFGWQSIAPDITPDVITLAKGLGGGMPIGALIAVGQTASSALAPGMHGTTFGGNPACAAAGLAVIEHIERADLLSHVSYLGAHLRASIEAMHHPLITEVRGAGLMIGIGLARPVAPVAAAALLEQGIIVNPANESTIRLVPPLTITAEELGAFVTALPRVLDACYSYDDAASQQED